MWSFSNTVSLFTSFQFQTDSSFLTHNTKKHYERLLSIHNIGRLVMMLKIKITLVLVSSFLNRFHYNSY
jgi:hypothetical protein